MDFFEHYSVSCTPCPMIHECVGRANLEIWNLETYVLQKAGNQEIQTLETSRRRSSGGGASIYIYIYIYIHTHTHIHIYTHIQDRYIDTQLPFASIQASLTKC